MYYSRNNYKSDQQRVYGLVFLMCCFIQINCTAQREVAPDVPEVGSLIRYIKEPVTFNKGRVGISIPLYTIVQDGIEIPISINYHHGGLKPNEKSPYLGIGWSLTAEPSIAITGKDIKPISPRERGTDLPSWQEKRAIYKGWATSEKPSELFYNLPNKSGTFFYNWTEDKGYYPVILPFEPIKIEDFNANLTSGSYFNITDENGVLYRFGQSLLDDDEYVVSMSRSDITQWKCTEIVPTSQHNIIHFDYYASINEEVISIDRSYMIEDVTGDHRLSARSYFGEEPPVDDATDCGFYYFGIIYGNDFRLPNIMYMHKGSMLTDYFYGSLTPVLHSNPKYCSNDITSPSSYNTYNRKIQAISFATGKVEFYMDGETLNSIVVKDLNGKQIKKIEFDSRLLNGDGTLPRSVGILDGVKISGKTDNIIEEYNFGYDGEPCTSFTTKVNFWGYYTSDIYSSNINNTPVCLLPLSISNGESTFQEYSWFGGMDREVEAGNNGILTTITNSIGRTTTFEYESDCYVKMETEEYSYDPDDANIPVHKKAGGRRIKKITNKDSKTGKSITREFKYGIKCKDHPYYNNFKYRDWKMLDPDEECGCGHIKRNITPKDFMTTKTKHMFYLHDGSVASYTDSRVRTLSTWLIGDFTYSGAPVFYDVVTEYNTIRQLNSNGVEEVIDNGKTIYKYSYESCNDEVYNGKFWDYHEDWKSGQLTSKQVYKHTDDTTNPYELVSRTDMEYESFYTDEVSVGNVIQTEYYTDPVNTNRISPIDEDRYENYEYWSYSFKTGVKKLKIQIDSIFTDNGVLVTKNEYEYNNPQHFYPTTIASTNSNKITKTTYLNYPQDAFNITDLYHLQARNKMNERHIISPILEEKIVTGDDFQSNYNYYQIYDNEEFPLCGKKVTKYMAEDLEHRMIYHKYDLDGNVLWLTDEQGVDHSFIWGYHKQYPIAVIDNATYDDIEGTDINIAGIQDISDNDFDNCQVGENCKEQQLRSMLAYLRNSLPLAHVSIFTYNPLVGMTSKTDPNGVITYYEYDDFGRLKCVKDQDGNIINMKTYHYNNQ